MECRGRQTENTGLWPHTTLYHQLRLLIPPVTISSVDEDLLLDVPPPVDGLDPLFGGHRVSRGAPVGHGGGRVVRLR